MQKSAYLKKEDICARIRAVAAEAGVSRTKLCASAGISYRLVHQIMHGEANLRDITISKIAKALGVSVSDLSGAPVVQHQSCSGNGSTQARTKTADDRAGTVAGAIRVLAEQFGWPEESVREMLIPMLLKHKQ